MSMSRDEFQDQLPQAVVDDLRSLYGRGPMVPAERSGFILSSARAQFARRQRMRLAMRVGGAAAAVAAMVLVVVMVMPERSGRMGTQGPISVQATSADRRDVNTDGSVNILDAYLLAKQVEREGAMDRALDFNLDGRVDRGDADAIAAAVVTLQEGAVR